MNSFKIILISLFIVLQSCNSSTSSDNKSITVEDFNWEITIPEGFEPINENDWDKTLDKGLEMMEESAGESIENLAKTNFTYKEGQFNNFESNWQPFDVEVDGDYSESNREVNKFIFQTFEDQMPDAKLDSSSSKQVVSGLEFYRFDISIDLPNGIKMKTTGFSRLFNKKELTVNITYVDEEIGEKMLNAFQNSTFN